MHYRVRVLGPRDPREKGVVMTTGNSGLSPFTLGPVKLYDDYISKNMENGWQYSKVYWEQLSITGEPSNRWWKWAKEGWDNPKAVRYPMGKGAVPKYAYWKGKHLNYIQARKKIYIPLYAKAVVKTEAFRNLRKRFNANEQLTLWDYDGYDYIKLGMTLKEVLNNPKRKMGHAFVLAMLLEQNPIVEKYLCQ